MRSILVFNLLLKASSASMPSGISHSNVSNEASNVRLRGSSRHLKHHRGPHDIKPVELASSLAKDPEEAIGGGDARHEVSTGAQDPHVADTADSTLVRDTIVEGDNIVIQYEVHEDDNLAAANDIIRQEQGIIAALESLDLQGALNDVEETALKKLEADVADKTAETTTAEETTTQTTTGDLILDFDEADAGNATATAVIMPEMMAPSGTAIEQRNGHDLDPSQNATTTTAETTQSDSEVGEEVYIVAILDTNNDMEEDNQPISDLAEGRNNVNEPPSAASGGDKQRRKRGEPREKEYPQMTWDDVVKSNENNKKKHNHDKKERAKKERTKEEHVEKMHTKKEHEKKERVKKERTKKGRDRNGDDGTSEHGKSGEPSGVNPGDVSLPFGMSMSPRDAMMKHQKKADRNKKNQGNNEKKKKKHRERRASAPRSLKQTRKHKGIETGHSHKHRNKGQDKADEALSTENVGDGMGSIDVTEKAFNSSKKNADRFDKFKKQVKSKPEKTVNTKETRAKVEEHMPMVIDDIPSLNGWLPTPAPTSESPNGGATLPNKEEITNPIDSGATLAPAVASVTPTFSPWPTDVIVQIPGDAPAAVANPASLAAVTQYPTWSPTFLPTNNPVLTATMTSATSGIATTEETTVSTMELVGATTSEEDSSPIGKPDLTECPPAYDATKTTYEAGDLAEVLEHTFQCRVGEGIMVELYVPYCNLQEWDDGLLDGNPEAKLLWSDAWVNIGPCEPVSLGEVLADEIEGER